MTNAALLIEIIVKKLYSLNQFVRTTVATPHS